jgi:hypothetical protein
MSAFREHFLDKYFGYRRRYVGAVAELAPNRRGLAVASEIARLGFSLAGCALVAFIMGIVFVGSFGHASWVLVATFGLIVLLPLIFIVFIVGGLRDAWLDRGTPAEAGR